MSMTVSWWWGIYRVRVLESGAPVEGSGSDRNFRGTRWKVLSRGSSCDSATPRGLSSLMLPLPFSFPGSWDLRGKSASPECASLHASYTCPETPGVG